MTLVNVSLAFSVMVLVVGLSSLSESEHKSYVAGWRWLCNKFLSKIAFVLSNMKFPNTIFSSDIIFAKCVGSCKGITTPSGSGSFEVWRLGWRLGMEVGGGSIFKRHNWLVFAAAPDTDARFGYSLRLLHTDSHQTRKTQRQHRYQMSCTHSFNVLLL